MSGPGRPSNLSRMVVERALRAAAEATVTRHDLLRNVEVSPDPPTPGATRMRRHRALKRQGAVAVDFVVGADAVRSLIDLAGLDPRHRTPWKKFSEADKLGDLQRLEMGMLFELLQPAMGSKNRNRSAIALA